MHVLFLLLQVLKYSWVVLIRPEIHDSYPYLKNIFMNGDKPTDLG
jgi:hypothetical protein